jgi:hypothetical protein
MALPFTDTFNGTAGTDIHTYNASWVENSLTFAISTPAPGLIVGGVNALCHWAGDAFNNDQFAQTTLGTNVVSAKQGPAVRVAVAANTAYFYRTNTTTSRELFKVVTGAFTNLGNSSGGQTNAAGDILTIVVAGTTITCYRNSIVDIGPVTDAAISSGSAGIGGTTSAGTALQISSFTGGNGNPFAPVVSGGSKSWLTIAAANALRGLRH